MATYSNHKYNAGFQDAKSFTWCQHIPEPFRYTQCLHIESTKEDPLHDIVRHASDHKQCLSILRLLFAECFYTCVPAKQGL